MPRKLKDDSERVALAIWNVIAIRIGAKEFGRTYFVTILKLEVPIALADSTYSFSDTESTFA